MKNFLIDKKEVGHKMTPYIIAEAGINHNGDVSKAIELAKMAKLSGADCIKFQYHITEAELIESDIKPGYLSQETLWNITKSIELSVEENKKVQEYCNSIGITYLSTPFSKEAADLLYEMNVPAFKIGSGECSNLPLIEHVAKMKRPIILSTGMNGIESIRQTVKIIQKYECPLVLMHCTSIYPTPYEKVRLGAIQQLLDEFNCPVGLSDHSDGPYTCFAAVALGACVLEKHFTVSKDWPGPDIGFSIDPKELADLVIGTRAIYSAMGGQKGFLEEERPVRDFAFASVVSIKNIKAGEAFSSKNIWVKKPGTGEIAASEYQSLLGKIAKHDVSIGQQLSYSMII
jgi:sialic acid synthase SpsE